MFKTAFSMKRKIKKMFHNNIPKWWPFKSFNQKKLFSHLFYQIPLYKKNRYKNCYNRLTKKPRYRKMFLNKKLKREKIRFFLILVDLF